MQAGRLRSSQEYLRSSHDACASVGRGKGFNKKFLTFFSKSIPVRRKTLPLSFKTIGLKAQTITLKPQTIGFKSKTFGLKRKTIGFKAQSNGLRGQFDTFNIIGKSISLAGHAKKVRTACGSGRLKISVCIV